MKTVDLHGLGVMLLVKNNIVSGKKDNKKVTDAKYLCVLGKCYF